MSSTFLRKAVLTGIFGLAALTAGGQAWRNANRVPTSKESPCVWEFVRDSRETASLLNGTFNYADAKGVMHWEFKFPPATTRQDIDHAFRANGYEQFFDPFHDGASFKKIVNGRWYHYVILNKEEGVEVHWEKSQPGTLPHMADVAASFVKTTPQAPDIDCDRRRLVGPSKSAGK
jgi:hypothetical protein